MIAFAFSLHALLNKPKSQLQQYRLSLYIQQVESNTPQCSSSLPPKYKRIEPTEEKTIKPKTATLIKSSVNSPLTKGCKKAKTTKAIAKLINPFPSSLATFLNLFIKTIINNNLRCAR